MKHLLHIVTILLFLPFGKVSSQPIEMDTSKPYLIWLYAMNDELIGEGYWDEFKDSSIVFHKKEFVEMDLELGVDRLQKIELRKKNREREGTLMGAFIGLVGGGFIGLVTSDSSYSEFDLLTFLYFGTPMMAIGALAGNQGGRKKVKIAFDGNMDNYLGFKASIRIKPKKTAPPLVDYW